ncbi:putative MFS family arabinose efflux permease [Paenibacillus phyllosphaerae]|uniref:Putative MFS family arabinose efflux permease n=1 Tax=Paenibacillus phyllosphaerae TaxID=274593 RepID=A0A7W5FL95_9BACL|nr:MFS transporter [Paenibacillus phyllosphaerae]MBB3108853.1 putative MFS family arabinose efflux permease [Paenibacillus phyllosphaerae]
MQSSAASQKQAAAAIKPQTQPVSMFNQSKAVLAVVFASIIAFMGLGLVDPILPAIAEKLHASHSDVTLLFTSYNAVMAVAMLITGVISSRLGVKWTLLTGIIIIAVFSALSGMSNGIWSLVWLRGGWGLGNALFVATALSAIVSLSRTGVARSIILFEVAVGLGISVGPLLGGELGAISWRGPFFGVAGLMVLAFLMISILMPKPAPAVRKKRASLADPFRALRFKALRTFGIAAALYNFGFFTLLVYAALVLGKLGLDEHQLGYVFLGWGLMLAFTSVFMAPKLQKRFGTLPSMMVQLLLFAVTLFVMANWTTDKTVLIVAVIVAGAFLGNNNTLITTAVMNAAPVERPTASAAYSFLRFIGGALAPYLAGKLAEWFNPHMPFIVGGAFVVLAVIYLYFNRNHLKHVDAVEGGH